MSSPSSTTFPNDLHIVFASDFASLQDLATYRRLKAEGNSEKYCLAHGDNGIGFYGDNTAQESIPMCALPPDDIIAQFGSAFKGHLAKVSVTIGTATAICALADHMPWKKNISNGCGIDLNPAALKSLGLHSPIRLKASWQWV